MAFIKRHNIKFLAIAILINIILTTALIQMLAWGQTPFYYPRYKSINTGVESSSAALDLTNATQANRRYTLNTTRGWQLISVYVTFTTASSRDITISDIRDTEVYTWSTTTGDTSTGIKITPNPAQDALQPDTYDLRIDFSQTAAACSATVRVIYATELR